MKKMFLLLLLIAGYMPLTAQDYFNGRKLYNDVTEYVKLGEHRTGTDADLKTAAWIRKRLREYGYQTSYQEFQTDQFFPESASLSDGAQEVKVFPVWPLGETTALLLELPVYNSMEDTSVNGNYEGKIVVIRLAHAEVGTLTPAYIKRLERIIQAGAKGIVAVTENSTNEIVALNSSPEVRPWPVPVVLAAPKDEEKLIALGRNGKNSRLEIKGKFKKQAEARNVIGRIGNGDKYVVISTPISGWFTCGGERGPGIAIFLELARWMAEYEQGYTFVFTATSGHELGGLGMHAFLKEEAPDISKTALWLHLGAGIGTYRYVTSAKGLEKTSEVEINRHVMYSAQMEKSIRENFEGIKANYSVVKDRAAGELDQVFRKGYGVYFGVASSHRFHHVPGDDASKTGPEILEPIAKAILHQVRSQIRQK